MLKALGEKARGLREARQDVSDDLWDWVDRFDRDCSNNWTIWEALPEEARRLFRDGARLHRRDPVAALAQLEEAALLGNPLAMVEAQKYHWHGIGTAEDRENANRFLADARDAGSWHAAILIARRASRHGDMETCFAILEEGVDANYTAAMFWLAWYQYRERPGRRTAREVLPLLETAIERGQPGARWLMARLLIRGRLGLPLMGEGRRMAKALCHELQEEREARAQAHPAT